MLPRKLILTQDNKKLYCTAFLMCIYLVFHNLYENFETDIHTTESYNIIYNLADTFEADMHLEIS